MSCQTFVARAFAVRTAAHIAHLTTQSYAQHVALDEFYTTLLDLTDRYAEVAMGREGRFSSLPSQVPPKGDIVEAIAVGQSHVDDQSVVGKPFDA